jgi:hypothetical protein
MRPAACSASMSSLNWVAMSSSVVVEVAGAVA